MKVILLDKANETVCTTVTQQREAPTCVYYRGKCYLFRMKHSDNRKWSYQEVSTLVVCEPDCAPGNDHG